MLSPYFLLAGMACLGAFFLTGLPFLRFIAARQPGLIAAASGLLPLGEATHRQLRELYESEIAPVIRGPY